MFLASGTLITAQKSNGVAFDRWVAEVLKRDRVLAAFDPQFEQRREKVGKVALQ